MPAPTMKFDEELQQEILPPEGGAVVSKETELRIFGSLITAQRVAVPRDEKRIMMRLREKSAINGDRYFYSWEARQKRGGKGLIEGPTIKAANLVARLYGNCAIDVRSMPYDATHDITYARFADLETGFSTVRAFKQRRDQDMGMSDKERAEDIAFQIGQSKAIRNVIANALDDFCQELVDQAKTALVDWLTNDPKNVEKAWNKIGAIQERYGITDKQIEDLIGRPNAEWLPRHLAKVLVAMRSIENGDATVKDIFGDAPTINREPNKPSDDKKPEGGKEGDAPDAKAGGAARGARKARQPAQTAESGGQAPATETQKAEAQPATQEQPAAAETKAASPQPAESTTAPDGGKSRLQGAADNLAAPTQQETKQPPEAPVGEDDSWFSSEA